MKLGEVAHHAPVPGLWLPGVDPLGGDPPFLSQILCKVLVAYEAESELAQEVGLLRQELDRGVVGGVSHWLILVSPTNGHCLRNGIIIFCYQTDR